MIFSDEARVSLEEAAKIIWSERSCREQAALDCYIYCLKSWGTAGMNGVVLETDLRHKKWVTSREAVERFLAKTFRQ